MFSTFIFWTLELKQVNLLLNHLPCFLWCIHTKLKLKWSFSLVCWVMQGSPSWWLTLFCLKDLKRYIQILNLKNRKEKMRQNLKFNIPYASFWVSCVPLITLFLQTCNKDPFVVKFQKVSVGRICLGNSETKLLIICSLQQALAVSEKIFTLGGKNISFFLPLCSSWVVGLCVCNVVNWTTDGQQTFCCSIVVQCCLACVLFCPATFITLLYTWQIGDPVRMSLI